MLTDGGVLPNPLCIFVSACREDASCSAYLLNAASAKRMMKGNCHDDSMPVTRTASGSAESVPYLFCPVQRYKEGVFWYWYTRHDLSSRLVPGPAGLEGGNNAGSSPRLPRRRRPKSVECEYEHAVSSWLCFFAVIIQRLSDQRFLLYIHFVHKQTGAEPLECGKGKGHPSSCGLFRGGNCRLLLE